MAQLIEFAGNHLILVGAFFFIVALLLVNLVQAGGSRAVIPVQAVQLFNRDDALPLDIRSTSDFAAGHIVNARNIPMADLKSRLDELKKAKDKPVVVYCATGTTSAAATRDLSAAGFERVYSLKGGIAAWRNENLPLTKQR
jgi:rhodanese-related sulfurtransferase